MTDHRDDPEGEDDAVLLRRLGAALTEAGELVPTSEAEVLRAEREQDDDEVELPPELEAFAPRTRTASRAARTADHHTRTEEPAHSEVRPPTDLGEYRRRRGLSLVTHFGALALGAAAAAALVLVWQKSTLPDSPLEGDPAGVVPSASGSDEAEQGPLALRVSCDGCCGGSECKTPKNGMASCPSGRACIACDTATLADSRYRLRIGAVHLAQFGLDTLEVYPTGQAEVCLRAGLSDEVCVDSSLKKTADGGAWSTLPVLVSGDDLAAKLSVRLRWKHVQNEALATAARWFAPVALTPYSLCQGYVLELKTETEKGDHIFGNMSLFIDDAYYVELARSSETGTLRDYRKRLQLDGLRVQLQQVRGDAGAGFVLAAGPFDRRTADQLRWQLLEQKQEAQTTVGADFTGAPLPLP
jgi:hypothetical protein